MNRFLIFICIVSLFSCNSIDKETLEFLNEGIETGNENIHAMNLNLSACIENLYKIDSKVKMYKFKCDTILQSADSVYKIIERIRNKVKPSNFDKIGPSLPKKYNGKEKNNPSLNKNYNYKKLISEMLNHKEILLTYSFSYEISDKINKELDIDFENGNLNLESINLIYNKILYFDNLVLEQFYTEAKLPQLKYNKFEVVFIPKRNEVKVGEFYEAEVFLSVIDTTLDFQVVIDNDTLQSEKGKVIYTKKTDNLGKQKIKGYFLGKAFRNDYTSRFKFESEYNVLQK